MRNNLGKKILLIIVFSVLFVITGTNCVAYAEDIADYRELLSGYSKPISKFEVKLYDDYGNLKNTAAASETSIIGECIPHLNAQVGDKLVITDLSYSRAGYSICEWDFQYYSEQDTCFRSNLRTDIEIVLHCACVWEFYLCVRDSAPMINGIENWSDNGNHRAIGIPTDDFPSGLYWYFTKVVVNVTSAASGNEQIAPAENYSIISKFNMPSTEFEGVNVCAVNSSLIDGMSYMDFIIQNPQIDVQFLWSIDGAGAYSIIEKNFDRFIFRSEPGVYSVTLEVRAGVSRANTTKTVQIFGLPVAKITCIGQYKVNRKLSISCNDSIIKIGCPINHEFDMWKIKAGNLDILNNSEYVVKRPYKNGTYELMFRKPGQFRIELVITDSRGLSSCAVKTVTISDDIAPVAIVNTAATALRNPNDMNNAYIGIADASYSVDGDTISSREWQILYDSDNDGDFNDETCMFYDVTYDYQQYSYKINKVGKLCNKITVHENISSEDTFEEFLRIEDYKKALNQKTVEVINVSPVVSFDGGTEVKADVNFIINKNDNVEGLFDNLTQFESALLGRGINSNVSVYSHEPELSSLVKWDGTARNSNGAYSEPYSLIGDKTRFYAMYGRGGAYVRCYDERFNYLWTYTPPSVKDNIAVATCPHIDGVYILYKKSNGYEYAKLDKHGNVVWTCQSNANLKTEPYNNKLVIDRYGNIVSPENIDNNGNFYTPAPSESAPFPYILRTNGKKLCNIQEKYVYDWCFVSGEYTNGQPFIQVFHRNNGYLFEVNFPSSYYKNFGFFIFKNNLAVFRHYKFSTKQKTEVLFYDVPTGQILYTLPLFPDLRGDGTLYTVQQANVINDKYVFFGNHRHKGFLLNIEEMTVTNLNDCTSFIDNLFFSHDYNRINSFVDWGDHGTVYSNFISKQVVDSYDEIISEIEYRANSYKYNVIINSGAMQVNKQEIVQLLNLLKGKFIFVGINQNGKIISNATGGIIIPYSQNMEDIVRSVSDYILGDIDNNQKQKSGSSVVAGEFFTINERYFSDYENDPPDNEERWRYMHDEHYYENGNGIAAFSGMVFSQPITYFDKVGKYEVTYQKSDDPTYGDDRFNNYKQWSSDKPNYCLYVHRPPIAEFRIIETLDNNIFIENKSYDPDRQSLGLYGIKVTEIRYKPVQQLNEWNTVYNTQKVTVDGSGEYIIGLRVQDWEGVWSDYKYELVKVTAEAQPEQIILDFIIPDCVNVFENIFPVEYTAITTYGNEAQRNWHYFDGVQWMGIQTDCFEAGNYFFETPGTYSIRLTGIYGTLNSEIIKHINVHPISMNVSAFINPNPAEAGEEIALTLYLSGNFDANSAEVIFSKPLIDSSGQLTDRVELFPDKAKTVWANIAKIGQKITDTETIGECYKALFRVYGNNNSIADEYVDLHIKTPLIVEAKAVNKDDLSLLLELHDINIEQVDISESHLQLLSTEELEYLLDSSGSTSQAASEEIIFLVSVGPDGANAMFDRAEIECTDVIRCEQMHFLKQCGSTGYFAKKIRIPEIKHDGNCTVYVRGFLSNDLYGNGSHKEVSTEFFVNTPVQLEPFINGACSNCEVTVGKTNIFTALTSKYVSELEINLNGVIYNSNQQNNFTVDEVQNGKMWTLKLDLDEKHYADISGMIVQYTACTPSGKSESAVLTASVMTICAHDFTITLMNNVDWRGFYFDLNMPIYEDGKPVGYQKRQNTEIKAYSMPVNTSPEGIHRINYRSNAVKAGSQIKGYVEVEGNPQNVTLIAHYIDKNSVKRNIDIATTCSKEGLYEYDWIVPLYVENESFIEFSIKILNDSVEYGNEKWVDIWNEGAEYKVLYIKGNVLEDDIIFNQSN